MIICRAEPSVKFGYGKLNYQCLELFNDIEEVDNANVELAQNVCVVDSDYFDFIDMTNKTILWRDIFYQIMQANEEKERNIIRVHLTKLKDDELAKVGCKL